MPATLLPLRPQLPRIPDMPDNPGLAKYLRDLCAAVADFHQTLALRLDKATLQGTFAQRPDADGTRRYYWATDTNTLYYDESGTWVEVGATTEVNDLTAAVTWANIPDANVPESAVTQHEAALTITESQISDLDHTDGDAIHDDVASEIHAITQKSTPAVADEVVIEDSAASWVKKRASLSAILALAEAASIPNFYFVSDYSNVLQDALDDCGSDGGGIVVADVATYNEAITMDYDDVWLVGMGYGTLINGGTTGHALEVNGDNCLVFRVRCATTAGSGNSYQGLHVVGDENLFIDVWVSASDHAGISSDGSSNVFFMCHVENADSNSFVDGTSSVRTRVSNCWFGSCGAGSNVNIQSDNSVICNNEIYSGTIRSTVLNSTSSYCVYTSNFDSGACVDLGSANVVGANS